MKHTPFAPMKQTSKKILFVSLTGLLILCLALLAFLLYQYQNIKRENTIQAFDEQKSILYIKPNDSWTLVEQKLKQQFRLRHPRLMHYYLKYKSSNSPVKAGAYKIDKNTSLSSLVNNITNGWQDELLIPIPSVRLNGSLERSLGKSLMADSATFAKVFQDSRFVRDSLGLNDSTLYPYILPDSYRMYWTISPEDLAIRLKNEYQAFWNESRKKKAEALDLTPFEVTTLASIVNEESSKADDFPKIASLYLNRLRKNMKLQSDPTVIFAHVRGFGIRRVTSDHLKIDSPYNTYLHTGLPPGPIRIPSKATINAVLDAPKTDYLFMCAKEDFSGYHNFSSSYAEHLQNARAYRRALSERMQDKP